MQAARKLNDEDHQIAFANLRRDPGDHIKVLLMDDNAFDRKAVTRVSRQSQYNIKLIETSSISETRTAIAEHSPDVLFLDFRVPDGDGVEFSRELASSHQDNAPPIVIITGEGDESVAVRSLRSGAVDYIPKTEMSVDLFNDAIHSALSSRRRFVGRDGTDLEAMHEELSALRHKTHMHMQLAKTYLAPMAQCAWQWLRDLPADQSKAEAPRLHRITKRLTGFLDETLVNAATECRDGTMRDLVPLHDVISFAVAETPGLAGKVRLADADSFPTIAGSWMHVLMLMNELFKECLKHTPANIEAQIAVDVASDPSGSPILRIADNGVPLADRMQALSDSSQSIGRSVVFPSDRILQMSLCQRLAEMNGAEFKVKDGSSGGCVALVRFSSTSQILQ